MHVRHQDIRQKLCCVMILLSMLSFFRNGSFTACIYLLLSFLYLTSADEDWLMVLVVNVFF